MTGKLSDTDLIAYALNLAPESADHAEDLLKFFCDAAAAAVDRGIMPDPDLMEYVSSCFKRILDGEKPETALNLRGRGKSRKPATLDRIAHEDLHLAFAVAQRRKSGMTREKAIQCVVDVGLRLGSRVISASYGKVEKAYGDYQNIVDELAATPLTSSQTK